SVPLILIACCALAAQRPDWQNLRKQVRETFHISDPLPNLQSKSYGSFSVAPDVTADRVSYATDYSLRVPAIVYHSAGATIVKHPGLVLINGHGGDKSTWYAYWTGILYARAGAVVVTYDPIGEYERNKERRSKTGQHDELAPPDDMARRMAGLMVTDAMQGVRYLAERRDVDEKRIAVLGFSMGSFINSLVCAIDTSIHACVLAGGGDLDGPGGYWDSSGKKMCQAIPYQSLKFLGDRGPMIFALHAKRGPTLVINGTADRVVDISHHGQDFFEGLRKQTIAELGSSKEVFDFTLIPEGGHSPYFLTKPGALWLQEKLKFPNWTKKQIEAMPETETNGMKALGPDIPAVPRDDLHAIPDAVWQSQQESYIYETWLDRAQVAIRTGAP
ncbi:MAG TPA: prolyl oligopeptidase family serine peptidase, partial [Bryobacteraceae bacterium]|nr:prolyl oligopeptidase family serine peptidase [Bryobacteraceae bacterium]